ncbi:MAG: hypothetical protein U9R74_11445 [Pseudomonadota bacterium]|nr:hypothetical protein [Pseudomonadota bacterium]
MLKTVKSYFIVDVLESMIYKLVQEEFSSVRDAEDAQRRMCHFYPDSRVREQRTIYDINNPDELTRYEAHMSRLA